MFHSDQGAQYTSKTFRKLLWTNKVVHSFSAPGQSHDNAVMESFFAFMEREEIKLFNTPTLIHRYFEVYQKLDFSGYYKVFEGLLTPLALSDNSDSGEERAKPTDEIPNGDDEQ